MQNKNMRSVSRFNNELKLKGFKVYETSSKDKDGHSYSRKDFYKIALTTGKFVFHYADKSIETSGATLMFFNSLVPYSWQPLNGCTAVSCIFNEAFFTDNLHTSLRDLPMFTPGNKPAYQLQEAQGIEIERIFEKMQADLSSDYRFKDDLICNYIL